MYLEFYELKDEPFRLTPDPKFLQLAEPHRHALKTLSQAITEHKGLMMFTGPVGTGKTTILNTLLSVLSQTYPPTALLTAFIVNPRLNRDEFLEALLAEFELPCTASKSSRIVGLHALLFAVSKAGGTCLLVVDEAHLLSADVLEEIRLLMNADTHRDKPLQVVLCGQPELSTLLREPGLSALRQRIAARASLRELTSSETRMYISERLRVAGLCKPLPFTLSSLDRMYEYTAGVPRLINILADTCLSIGYETKRKQIHDDIVEEAAVQNELQLSMSNGDPATPVVSALNDSQPATSTSRSEL
jgi:general secretion pathway protein A